MAYRVAVHCSNCEWQGHITILGGKFVENQYCPTCQCKEVLGLQWGASAYKVEEKVA